MTCGSAGDVQPALCTLFPSECMCSALLAGQVQPAGHRGPCIHIWHYLCAREPSETAVAAQRGFEAAQRLLLVPSEEQKVSDFDYVQPW
jgi:hypothetical protein